MGGGDRPPEEGQLLSKNTIKNMSNENEGKGLTLAEFVPAAAELQTLAQRAKTVDVTDIEQVHAVRIELRDARINITKKGKELRDGALKFQKEVISRERQLIGIVEPEEQRLANVEETAKLKAQMEARKEELPTRRAALATIGDAVEVTDEELLAMDDNEFNEYRLRRIDAKLAKDKEDHERKVREEAEAERKRKEAEDKERDEKRKAEEAKLAEEKAKLDAERAAIEAEKRAKAEAEAERERELARKEREAKLEEERKAKEAAEKKAAEEAKLKEEAFQSWLKEVGFDEKTDITQVQEDGSIVVWRKVGTYKHNGK